MKPPLLKPFVIHRIAATLSVQQLHNLAVLAYKNIDITVGRIKAHAAYLTAHPVYSYTHIARMLSHDYAVVFIQIEHSVFVCKVRKQKRYSKVGFFRMDTFFLFPGSTFFYFFTDGYKAAGAAPVEGAAPVKMFSG